MQPKPTAETVPCRQTRRRIVENLPEGRGGDLKLGLGCAFDRLGKGMRQASVAEVAHVQAIAGQEQAQRLRALGAPAFHQRVAAQHRHMVRGADIVDHLDEPLVANGVGALQGELRADEHHRNARGARGGNAGLHGGAKQGLIDAHDRVVGADLPDDQPRPARLQRAFQPLQGLRRRVRRQPRRF